MNKQTSQKVRVLLWPVICVVVLILGVSQAAAYSWDSFSLVREPSLSANGTTLYNGVAPLVMVVDHNPAMQGIKIPGLKGRDALAAVDAAASTFSIIYIAAGGTDLWGEPCLAFPEAAKTAFDAGAAI